MIIQNLIRAGAGAAQNRQPHEAHLGAYEKFMFLMTVTVAHELMHFFVGYLTGLSSDGTLVGESGRAWEAFVLGGVVETFENVRNPLGAYQAGDFYVIDAQQVARRLDHSCVRRILALDFTFPLQTIGTSTTLSSLDRSARSMKKVRTAVLSQTRIPSPGRDRCGPSTISRDTMRAFLVKFEDRYASV
ncbi:hypothetical protein JX265_004004 [Neoarthrinium moseri]|uniref:Uncharacterized protein n=1 Tax=Neoarthrinium moseri TaxID=1658444 RepID=A0A9P9WRK4_9PEZI|nr:uncharacterized protein JN550_006757 [Neoarthrinium moseri]KAI1867950.1 hypothetical protein JN550_006757 [Neoarthrinium moseri]KAI1876478.1 hypothetical protein JX265_004004 [Neoarthrinium moseri]